MVRNVVRNMVGLASISDPKFGPYKDEASTTLHGDVDAEKNEYVKQAEKEDEQVDNTQVGTTVDQVKQDEKEDEQVYTKVEQVYTKVEQVQQVEQHDTHKGKVEDQIEEQVGQVGHKDACTEGQVEVKFKFPRCKQIEQTARALKEAQNKESGLETLLCSQMEKCNLTAVACRDAIAEVHRLEDHLKALCTSSS